ncbi:hypothetical protein [Thalassobaculum sp.]|uniref:hypothetical protein n=1 Tax=Thalassobaculum sp. TaxID=2022740 RepID=UPI0032EDDEDE
MTEFDLGRMSRRCFERPAAFSLAVIPDRVAIGGTDPEPSRLQNGGRCLSHRGFRLVRADARPSGMTAEEKARPWSAQAASRGRSGR